MRNLIAAISFSLTILLWLPPAIAQTMPQPFMPVNGVNCLLISEVPYAISLMNIVMKDNDKAVNNDVDAAMKVAGLSCRWGPGVAVYLGVIDGADFSVAGVEYETHMFEAWRRQVFTPMRKPKFTPPAAKRRSA